MGKAAPQAGYEIEPREEGLEQKEAGTGGKILILEVQFGDLVEIGAGLCFTVFHLWSPPWWARTRHVRRMGTSCGAFPCRWACGHVQRRARHHRRCP